MYIILLNFIIITLLLYLVLESNYFIGKKKRKGGVNAEQVDNLGFGTVMILDERKIRNGKYLFFGQPNLAQYISGRSRHQFLQNKYHLILKKR